MQLGLAYLQQGDMQRAKFKLLLALQQAPKSAATLDAMAYFLETTGQISRAEYYYQQAIQSAPDNGSALNNYGTFLCRIGRYSAGEQQFLAAVKDPDYLNTAEAYENAGLCVLVASNTSKASNYFRLALQQDPRRSSAWLELALLNYDQNNYQQARQYLDHYLQLVTPDDQALLLARHLGITLTNNNLVSQTSN